MQFWYNCSAFLYAIKKQSWRCEQEGSSSSIQVTLQTRVLYTESILEGSTCTELHVQYRGSAVIEL